MAGQSGTEALEVAAQAPSGVSDTVFGMTARSARTAWHSKAQVQVRTTADVVLEVDELAEDATTSLTPCAGETCGQLDMAQQKR
jgi:hypothetical protein